MVKISKAATKALNAAIKIHLQGRYFHISKIYETEGETIAETKGKTYVKAVNPIPHWARFPRHMYDKRARAKRHNDTVKSIIFGETYGI